MGWVVAGLAALAGLLLAGAFLAHRAEKARRSALAALARSWGVRFSTAQERRPADRFPGHDWFEQGDDQWLCNTLAGETDVGGRLRPVHAGDFVYEERSRDADGNLQTSTHERSYFLVDLGLATPALAVRPEHFGDKVKGLFGFRDLEFESAQFNGRFHVRASDKKFAYDVCHPRAQELLLGAPFAAFTLVDGRLLVPGEERWAATTFAGARDFAAALLASWPAFVWDELAAAAGVTVTRAGRGPAG
jgi:hypothetical protein